MKPQSGLNYKLYFRPWRSLVVAETISGFPPWRQLLRLRTGQVCAWRSEGGGPGGPDPPRNVKAY
ncbi:hypothetical protein J6590_009239 [Homalodisca vitripennis]|nr:hypothetical protein J6590_009239 [Homalodisca vitripennis]